MIQRERVLEPTVMYELLEHACVALDRAGGDADLVRAATRDDLVAEGVSQDVERLPERLSGVRLAELGPEEAEELIAPVEAALCLDGQIDEQCQPLRLGEHRADLSTVGSVQREPTEHVEANHPAFGSDDSRYGAGRHAASDGSVTAPLRGAVTVAA